jgi:hypothetical protein
MPRASTIATVLLCQRAHRYFWVLVAAGPLLLGHNSNDGTAAVGHLPITAEGYKLSVQSLIVVVMVVV